MADRNWANSRIYTQHVMPVQLDARIAIGSSGAPTITKALGMTSITRMAAGIYQIQFQDNYNGLLSCSASFESAQTGGNVTAGSFVTGTAYTITAVGSTNWTAIGLPTGVTAAVGSVFVASGAGSGTGTAKATADSGIENVEVIGGLQNAQPFQYPNGAYLLIQCISSAGSTADPTSGSTMELRFLMNNSSLQ